MADWFDGRPAGAEIGQDIGIEPDVDGLFSVLVHKSVSSARGSNPVDNGSSGSHEILDRDTRPNFTGEVP